MAERARREKMSSVDTAWLRMDRPHNLMMICGVLRFEGPLAFERLRRLVDERFLVFRRFRQRAVELPGFTVWENDPHFDLDRHVVHVALPGRAGKRELQALVSRLIATPLDPQRPMWQFHLVERLQRRQRARHAHASLLRGRHRARPRDAVDDRCVRRWPAGHALRPATPLARVERGLDGRRR